MLFGVILCSQTSAYQHMKMEGNHAQNWMGKGEEMVCRECYSQIHFMLTNIDGELCSCSFPVDRGGGGGLIHSQSQLNGGLNIAKSRLSSVFC